ncbi:MAG: hypothetical protein IPH07_26000 [Deltaproteobacteria bacterium]|nr:hypothetical protein [Deltaproteobacteria bacterium]MBK8240508.1 hypothetical protein [Deltaproteobacteria bacterium]MBK8718213.1 hypothetical protein [Deltaproteobacteria bacterium]MBP7288999.1 hypothetical protein [Nannocystaceae bacterium]
MTTTMQLAAVFAATLVGTAAHASPPSTLASRAQPAASPGSPTTWDEVDREIDVHTTTTTTTTHDGPPPPVVVYVQPAAPAATPAPAIDPDVIEDHRREGNGLLVGAGVASAFGLVLNGVRGFLVQGPCQTASQGGCRPGWFLASTGAWIANVTSFTLAGVGGSTRGRADATRDRERHRLRSTRFTVTGASLLTLGVIGSVGLRLVWLVDYSSPGGAEMLDFKYPLDAAAYYGGQQLSAMAVAYGLAALTYGTARPMRRPLSLAPMTGRNLVGLQLGGRF